MNIENAIRIMNNTIVSGMNKSAMLVVQRAGFDSV
jgi:hypothetical protein